MKKRVRITIDSSNSNSSAHTVIRGIVVSLCDNGDENRLSFIAKLENGRKFLDLCYNGKKIDVTLIKKYLEANIKTITERFKKMDEDGISQTQWDLSIDDNTVIHKSVSFENLRQLELYLTRRIPYPNYVRKVEVKGESPSIEEITDLVKVRRGTIVKTEFNCSLCNNMHYEGHSFVIRGHKVYVCNHCRGDIKEFNPSQKVLLTNMGHKR